MNKRLEIMLRVNKKTLNLSKRKSIFLKPYKDILKAAKKLNVMTSVSKYKESNQRCFNLMVE